MEQNLQQNQDSTSPPPSSDQPAKTIPKMFPLLVLPILLIIAGFLFLKFFRIKTPLTPSPIKKEIPLKQFSSFEEFKSYMTSAQSNIQDQIGINAAEKSSVELGTAPERVSTTNVQVIGIDEPDIVKTDGNEIYFSKKNPTVYYQAQPEARSSATKVITAFPLEKMAERSEIAKAGDLLLLDKVLLIISDRSLYGFDVADPENAKEIYKYDFDSRQRIISSRLYKEKVYLALQMSSGYDKCDLPLVSGDSGLDLKCTDIYYPGINISADSVFTLLKLDLKSGKIEKRSSFVASSGQSVVYMSEESIFLTYTYSEDYIGFIYDFYLSDGKDLITDDVLARLKTLKDLDLSLQAKYMELSVILEKYKQTLSEDDLLKIENETQNKLSSYLKGKARDIEKTGVVKIALNDLSIVANASVPGQPLNQFSLDEYQGNLRIATTIDGSRFGSDTSVNDVYILDKNLDALGKITDLGQEERIYSARFIKEKGYLVTFKETDPFYILDLADSKNPKKAGELKIPGYSSYLHPLEKNLILGVGKENQNVKLSLFDVSAADNPQETAKYNLDEYWTGVLETHRAFLQDEKYQIFFLPGSKGGYIFSYAEGGLELLKAVSLPGLQRALFINDYLYLLAENKITVLDEKTWETKTSLDF